MKSNFKQESQKNNKNISKVDYRVNKKSKNNSQSPLQKFRSFKTKVVQMRRVSKTVKGGKKLTFSAVIIIGDEKGKVGVGVGRASDANVAIEKATYNGKKNLIEVPLTKNSSLPHIIEGHYGASHVIIKPAVAGTGVIAGGPVRTVLELAGIKNVVSKQLGSSNIINNARSTLLALSNLRDVETICEDRSISFKIFLKRVINF
jgi:small subunit ribosomal protein S5